MQIENELSKICSLITTFCWEDAITRGRQQLQPIDRTYLQDGMSRLRSGRRRSNDKAEM